MASFKICCCCDKDLGMTFIGLAQLNLALFYWAKASSLLSYYWLFHVSFAILLSVQFSFFGFFARQDTPESRLTYSKVQLITTIIYAVVALIFAFTKWVEWKAFPLYVFLIQASLIAFLSYSTSVINRYSDLLNHTGHQNMIETKALNSLN